MSSCNALAPPSADHLPPIPALLEKTAKVLSKKARFPTIEADLLPASLIQKACPVTDEESPPAPLLDVTALALALQRFADDRDWQQFHSPKNLAMALTGEVGELCELFQWMSEADSARAAEHPELGQPLRDELADVFMYLVRLSHVLGVDLNEAVTRKLALNG